MDVVKINIVLNITTSRYESIILSGRCLICFAAKQNSKYRTDPLTCRYIHLANNGVNLLLPPEHGLNKLLETFLGNVSPY